jgi:hypothetical protein
VNWCSRQDSHLQPPRSKRGALIIVPREQKGRRKIAESRRSRVVRTTPERLKDFSIRFLPSKLKWSQWSRALRAANVLRAGRSGGAQAPAVAAEPHRRNGGSPRCCPVLCGLRDRCIAAMLATRRRRDAKVELNHRNQACEVLADTGIRVAKRFPSAPNPAPGHYFGRARPRWARRIRSGNWTSIRVARPVFRFGRPACISQHLCSKKWSPVWESHPRRVPVRKHFCRPPPELLG